jgi:hypothetical protein
MSRLWSPAAGHRRVDADGRHLAMRVELQPKWMGRPAGAHIPYEAVVPEPIAPVK